MYRLITNALLKKTILCSPLTNKNISETELTKTMQTDCYMFLIYPAKLSFFLENLVTFFTLSAIILYSAGFAGFIGILLLTATMLFRFVFKKFVNRIDA